MQLPDIVVELWRTDCYNRKKNCRNYGRGAGELPTASAVVGDIFAIARNLQYECSFLIVSIEYEVKNCPVGAGQFFVIVAKNSDVTTETDWKAM